MSRKDCLIIDITGTSKRLASFLQNLKLEGTVSLHLQKCTGKRRVENTEVMPTLHTWTQVRVVTVGRNREN